MTDRPMLDRRRFLLLAGAAALSACSGGVRPEDDTAAAAAAPSPSAEPSPTATAAPAPSPDASPAPVYVDPANMTGDVDLPEGIVPTRIQIPAIGVDATTVEVSLRADEVEVPDFGFAGWWVQTRRPGEIGPAVIGAHVDSKAGPDVFYRLRDLRAGDEITVSDDSGTSHTFVVNADPIQVDKYERPPEVFGFGEPRPELRLITCGGDFNPAIGHYTDNIVVFAHDPTFEA